MMSSRLSVFIRPVRKCRASITAQPNLVPILQSCCSVTVSQPAFLTRFPAVSLLMQPAIQKFAP